MKILSKLKLLFISGTMVVVSMNVQAACPTSDPYCAPPGMTSYSLQASLGGWNLIGYSGGQNIDTHTLLSQLASTSTTTKIVYNVISAWKYDTSTGGWFYFNPAISSANFAATMTANNLTYNELTTISPGDGIWIRVREAMPLSLP